MLWIELCSQKRWWCPKPSAPVIKTVSEDFVDVINLRIWKWDHPGLSQYTLNPMTNVRIRDTQRRGTQEKEKAMCKSRQALELCSPNPRNTSSHQKLEKSRKDSSLALGGSMFLLYFRLLAPKMVREYISILLSQQICNSFLQQP